MASSPDGARYRARGRVAVHQRDAVVVASGLSGRTAGSAASGASADSGRRASPAGRRIPVGRLVVSVPSTVTCLLVGMGNFVGMRALVVYPFSIG